MKVPIHLPDIGASPVFLSHWFAELGETVFQGDRLIEVLVSGATFDVSSPATGQLSEKRVRYNDELAAGQVLGVVERHDEDPQS